MTLPTSGDVSLDLVYTRYAYNKIGGSEYKNQKYQRRPLLRLLYERKKTGDGGQSIVHPVNLGTSASGKSLDRNETFDVRFRRRLLADLITTVIVPLPVIRGARDRAVEDVVRHGTQELKSILAEDTVSERCRVGHDHILSTVRIPNTARPCRMIRAVRSQSNRRLWRTLSSSARRTWQFS